MNNNYLDQVIHELELDVNEAKALKEFIVMAKKCQKGEIKQSDLKKSIKNSIDNLI